ncbi:hypothetical protein OPQ81_007208 [Rhizoctonia solani]|nr:hypothetical protein OPQ81_007208 [Rhizoctonia solani]
MCLLTPLSFASTLESADPTTAARDIFELYAPKPITHHPVFGRPRGHKNTAIHLQFDPHYAHVGLSARIDVAARKLSSGYGRRHRRR